MCWLFYLFLFRSRKPLLRIWNAIQSCTIYVVFFYLYGFFFTYKVSWLPLNYNIKLFEQRNMNSIFAISEKILILLLNFVNFILFQCLPFYKKFITVFNSLVPIIATNHQAFWKPPPPQFHSLLTEGNRQKHSWIGYVDIWQTWTIFHIRIYGFLTIFLK